MSEASQKEKNPAPAGHPEPSARQAEREGRRYVVPMFPYPSGTLHVGHARNYAIADAIAKIAQMDGKKTLFPIGWDAFGLPAENAAIERGVAPSEWTRQNIAAMKKSLQAMQFDFDWGREIATCDPQTYRFSQLFFTRMLKAGIIYRSRSTVNWDPAEKTVLAREQVIEGRGWRSGALVEQREMPCWTARVSAYAQELLDGLDELDWPDTAKAIGRAWIGEGQGEGGGWRIHDWSLSRQRYWGCPVPMVECERCGDVPVPEEQLPVRLPEDVRLAAPGNPLESMEAWRACACPECGGSARRSAETLDTFFDSSWYFLRYPSVGEPGSEERPMVEAGAGWAPVDHYVGGIEHASMHLIYARFFCKALADMGFDAPREPFRKLTAQGIVCAQTFRESTPQGERFIAPSEIEERGGALFARATGNPVSRGAFDKMSKSKKNGQGIDELVAAGRSPGAIRFALLFAGPFAKNIQWDGRGLDAAEKALARLQAACEAAASAPGETADDVREAHGAFAESARKERERGEGLNVAIGSALGALRVAEKALREGRGGRDAREALLGVCAGLWPVAPRETERAARAIEPDWSAVKAGHPAAKAARAKPVAVQANGRFVQAVDLPATPDAQEALRAAFERCPALAERVDPERVSAVHWKPGRALNVLGEAPGNAEKRAATQEPGARPGKKSP
jgi:leucyl-tRNA synthetase